MGWVGGWVGGCLDYLELLRKKRITLIYSKNTFSLINMLFRTSSAWLGLTATRLDLGAKRAQMDSYCRFVSPLRRTPDPITSGSHTKAAGISISGGRPELLHWLRPCWCPSVQDDTIHNGDIQHAPPPPQAPPAVQHAPPPPQEPPSIPSPMEMTEINGGMSTVLPWVISQ